MQSQKAVKCIKGCGRETYNTDGICAVCTVNERAESKIKENQQMAEQVKIDFRHTLKNTPLNPLLIEGKAGTGERLKSEERAIMGLIKRGRGNAIQSKEISRFTGLSDVEIRQTIRHLIMEHGVLIASSVSNQKGFYIACNENEIREATRSLRHRGISILVRAAKLQKLSLVEIFNQTLLEFGGNYEN